MRNLMQYFILNIIKLGIKSFPKSIFPWSQVPFVICSHIPAGRLLYDDSHGQRGGWRAPFTHDFPLSPVAEGHKRKTKAPCHWWHLPIRAHMCCLYFLLFTWVYNTPPKNRTWTLRISYSRVHPYKSKHCFWMLARVYLFQRDEEYWGQSPGEGLGIVEKAREQYFNR